MIWSTAKVGNVRLVRLDYGSDLIESIISFVNEERIDAAIFYALGALKEASFSFYDQDSKKYVKLKVDQPLEILCCMGNVLKLKGKPFVHAHIMVSDRDGRAFGGHLEFGSKVFACELFLTELKDVSMVREYDSTTGLNLISFEKRSNKK